MVVVFIGTCFHHFTSAVQDCFDRLHLSYSQIHVLADLSEGGTGKGFEYFISVHYCFDLLSEFFELMGVVIVVILRIIHLTRPHFGIKGTLPISLDCNIISLLTSTYLKY